MKWGKFKEYIYKEKWLVAAILFFIVWKFFLIGILWQDRSIPPEPDDSYNYITQIASIAECTTEGCFSTNITLQNSSGFNYLTYRVFFGIIGNISNLPIQTVYHLGFYLGILFLVSTLVPLLKSFTKNKSLIAWSIFFLSFYHGFGETHGFFWVVPSFYFVVFFFLLALFIMRDELRLPTWAIFGLTFLYTFVHPMSVFTILIIPLYLAFFSFFTWSLPYLAWKKTILTTILVFSFSLTAHHLLPNNAPTQQAYSIKHAVGEVKSLIKKNSQYSSDLSTPERTVDLPRFQPNISPSLHSIVNEKITNLNHAYFRWLLPHWLFIFPLLITFFILAFRKNIKLLSLYFASFLFFIVATIFNEFGYRSAIILWPITFLLFAFSSWHLIQILRQSTNWQFKKLFFWFFTLILGGFFFLNGIYAIVFNENFNARNNYKIEQGLIDYLINEIPREKTIMVSREMLITEMFTSAQLRERVSSYVPEPDILVITNIEHIPKKEPSFLYQTINTVLQSKDKLSTHPSISPYNIPSNYQYDREFGMFTVYKKLP